MEAVQSPLSKVLPDGTAAPYEAWTPGSSEPALLPANQVAYESGVVCSPEEEIQRLRQELAERQAAIIKHQGETFLLNTQVKQLEQQVWEASRDAQLCSSQLAQVLQLMDSAGGRVPLKGEVDRARTLVTASRRTIRRVACLSAEDAAPTGFRSSANSVGGASASSAGAGSAPASAPRGNGSLGGGHNTDRRGSPRGRPRSPRGMASSGLQTSQRNGELSQGLAASAAAAVGEADSKTASVLNGTSTPSQAGVGPSGGASARSASQARQPQGFAKPKAVAKEGPRARRARDRVSNGGAGQTDEQPHYALPMTPTTVSPFSTAGQLGGGGNDLVQSPGVQSESSPRSAASLREQLSEVQQQFLRQREMLVLALRKGAQIEEQTNSMRDDLIRKDVVIHNLRQELAGQQQETKVQQQQYEQQAQQLQQQHLQHLQQVRQLQEMQAVLQQQQQLLQQQHSVPAEVAQLEVPIPVPVDDAAKRQTELESLPQ
eukprot:TRINITY_DN31913_c0_g1_i1.p1 TRINITY_DN31913_c0_g1~~TRINITY_DN31913_c0_g1_i1.p1  ORF type:complete len:562 (-),score=118.62 TRINITY_DN31913_c0_g1_i1:75-1538(-)